MMNDYPVFIEKVKTKTGIDLSLYKEQQMKRRLTSLSTRYGCPDLTSFYREMVKNTDLMDSFLSHMTINVTEFFRNRNQWEVLENKILPELTSHRKTIKVWSAACSTGEEPYSLGILLSNHLNPARVSILATDLDGVILAKAKLGSYEERTLKGLTEEEKKQYFVKDSSIYQVNEKIRRMVNFQRHDLLKDSYPVNVDLIVCRNVMIYFTEEAKAKMVKQFSQSLRKGGVLFLGSTESLSDPLKHGLQQIQSFFYQKV